MSDDGIVDVPCCVSVERPVRAHPGEILIIPLCADHRAVVTTELERRHVEPVAVLSALFFELCADERVRGDTACGDEYLAPALLHGEHRARDELVDNGLREVARKRGAVELFSGLICVVRKVDNGGFECKDIVN